MASYHWALAKRVEATRSPRSWDTTGSRKLLAPLKRVSVVLSSRRVAWEKGIKRATQGEKEVASGERGQTGEGCVGLHNHLYDYATLVASRWPLFDHPNTSSGHGTRTSKAVQVTKILVNMLIFGRFTFPPFHTLQVKMDHIGLNIRL